MWKKKCATPFLLQFISFPKRQHFSNYDRKIFELTLSFFDSIDVNKNGLIIHSLLAPRTDRLSLDEQVHSRTTQI